ncbi:MAG: threonine synthase [Myxococcales bacterium]|nr:threonine synthase [Myxococcales bacterium]
MTEYTARAMAAFVYRCTDCRREFPRDTVRYLCPDCGARYRPGVPLIGVLEAVFDVEVITKKLDRARPDWSLLSAVEPQFFPPLVVGRTPLVPARRLGEQLGLPKLFIKNDGQNPSGSLKDRASFLVVAEAARLGEKRVVCASTGNAASALAAVCASAGVEALIFVPEKAPRAKLVQMVLAGARVIPVKGTYDDAFRLSLEFTAKRGGLNRNTAYHPLTIEGKKTVSLEIAEQLGLRAPDAVFVSAGDGVILAGVHKGFADLVRVGLISSMPKLFAVQAEKSDAIHRYVQTGVYSDAVDPTTVADSISVSCPSNAHWARRAILETKGATVTVSDDEILEAQARLAAMTGVFTEPASAAGFAGLVKVQAGAGALPKDAEVVLLATGHGLKDIEAPLARVKIPPAIEPTLDAVLVS